MKASPGARDSEVERGISFELEFISLDFERPRARDDGEGGGRAGLVGEHKVGDKNWVTPTELSIAIATDCKPSEPH